MTADVLTRAACTGDRTVQIRRSSLLWLVLVAIGLTAFLDSPARRDLAAATAPQTAPATTTGNSEQKALDAYGKLPLAFVPNAGQSDARVRYSAQTAGASFYFTRKEAVLALAKGKKGVALRLAFLGANPNPRIEGALPGTGRVNYLVGKDPAKWHTNLPTYGQVVYRDLWPGIDMVFRGDAGKLKYEFVLRPGARVANIKLAYRGALDLSVSRAGALVIGTPIGVLRDERPHSYQEIGGQHVPVASRYALQGGTSYGFAVSRGYDRGRPLVVDPGLVYSTFLGGPSVFERGTGIAVDPSGSAYVTGITSFVGFPTTPGAFDPTPNGDQEAFVTKLNPAGSALVYSTYLGGGSVDQGSGIAVDRSGNALVTGETFSPDFPTTAGAFDPTFNGVDDAFVTKLNPAGSALVYSTFLGGTTRDFGFGIAVDRVGRAHVSGDTNSADFPTTSGAYDTTFNGGEFDAFVTKLNAAGSALVSSSYLGGTSRDDSFAIAVDEEDGQAVLTGQTFSADFPTTGGAFDSTFNGVADVYATKFNRDGSALVYSTFLGGSDGVREFGRGVAVDPDGRAYVTGETGSPDFPTTAGAFDPIYNGGEDAFVTKLNQSGSALIYSTYLGGTSFDEGQAIAVDRDGRAHVSTQTASPDFPTTVGAFDSTFNGGTDAGVTQLNRSGSGLLYSTFLGGSAVEDAEGVAVDQQGNVYVTGQTFSADFPTTAGAFDPTYNGGSDAYVTKLDLAPACPDGDDDLDDDGLDDEREGFFGTLLGDSDSDDNGVRDGNEDSDDDGEDDEDEDDDTDPCPDDEDGDGEDDEDEDDG